MIQCSDVLIQIWIRIWIQGFLWWICILRWHVAQYRSGLLPVPTRSKSRTLLIFRAWLSIAKLSIQPLQAPQYKLVPGFQDWPPSQLLSSNS